MSNVRIIDDPRVVLGLLAIRRGLDVLARGRRDLTWMEWDELIAAAPDRGPFKYTDEALAKYRESLRRRREQQFGVKEQ